MIVLNVHGARLNCRQTSFLDAFSHLYERVCPSVHRSVRLSVGLSVRPSHTSWNRAKVPFLTKTTISTSENASYAVYPALFIWIIVTCCNRWLFIHASLDFLFVVTQFNQSRRWWPMDLQLALMEVSSNWMLAGLLTPLPRQPFAPFRTRCLLAWLKPMCLQPETKMAQYS